MYNDHGVAFRSTDACHLYTAEPPSSHTQGLAPVAATNVGRIGFKPWAKAKMERFPRRYLASGRWE